MKREKTFTNIYLILHIGTIALNRFINSDSSPFQDYTLQIIWLSLSVLFFIGAIIYKYKTQRKSLYLNALLIFLLLNILSYTLELFPIKALSGLGGPLALIQVIIVIALVLLDFKHWLTSTEWEYTKNPEENSSGFNIYIVLNNPITWPKISSLSV